jgi:hypothetical protein
VKINRMLMVVVLILVIIVAIAAGIIGLVAHAGGTSSQDSALQSTLQTMKSSLDKRGALPVTEPTLQSFQAWVYNTRTAFLKAVPHQPDHQFSQVVLNDPNTMPPQTIGLNEAAHPVNAIPKNAITRAQTSTDAQCGDTTSGSGVTLRFCTIALKTPGVLQSSNATALLTVFAPKT